MGQWPLLVKKVSNFSQVVNRGAIGDFVTKFTDKSDGEKTFESHSASGLKLRAQV